MVSYEFEWKGLKISLKKIDCLEKMWEVIWQNEKKKLYKWIMRLKEFGAIIDH